MQSSVLLSSSLFGEVEIWSAGADAAGVFPVAVFEAHTEELKSFYQGWQKGFSKTFSTNTSLKKIL